MSLDLCARSNESFSDAFKMWSGNHCLWHVVVSNLSLRRLLHCATQDVACSGQIYNVALHCFHQSECVQWVSQMFVIHATCRRFHSMCCVITVCRQQRGLLVTKLVGLTGEKSRTQSLRARASCKHFARKCAAVRFGIVSLSNTSLIIHINLAIWVCLHYSNVG